ncbi:MAG: hypothetical protein CMA58_01545 [Euryarchaeota archaeon]|nr:hypothetical protein [Euryarchaeota archaeon]
MTYSAKVKKRNPPRSPDPGQKTQPQTMAASLAQEILQMRHPTPRYCQSHRDGIKYEDPTPDPTRWTISPQVTAKSEEPKSEEPKSEEPKSEEPKVEEPKTEEPKTEEPKKIFKESVKLDISKEDIGLFVGAKGATIRKYVTERTQKGISSPSRIRCSLKANEDGVYVYMKTETEEAMVTMKKFLMKHSESFVKRKKFAGQTRFVFKVPMDHCRIPKFIGTRGKNIKSLKEDIIQEDKNLTEEKIQVQIREDAPMRMKYLRFGVIKVDTDSDNEVLITVIIKTNNREESWKIAERLVKEHVEKASKNHHREDDPFEDNGW